MGSIRAVFVSALLLSGTFGCMSGDLTFDRGTPDAPRCDWCGSTPTTTFSTTSPTCTIDRENAVLIVEGLDPSSVGCVHDVPGYSGAAAVEPDGTARLESLNEDTLDSGEVSVELYGVWVNSSSCSDWLSESSSIACTAGELSTDDSSTTDGGTCSTPRHDRTMYVWDNALNVIPDGPGRTTLFDFMSAPRGDSTAALDGLYLEVRKSARPDGTQDPEKPKKPTEAHYDDDLDFLGPDAATLRDFLRAAHAAGVERVELLDGNPYWLFDEYRDDQNPANDYVPVELCRQVVEFNRAGDCTAGECLDGIHLDIEPHVVRDSQALWVGEGWWDEASVTTADITQGNRDLYNNRMSQALIDIVRGCRQAIGSAPIELSLALGHDYVYYHVDLRPLFLGLGPSHAYNHNGVDYRGLLDSVTIMNYRDYDDSMATNEFVDGWFEGDHHVGGLAKNLDASVREDPSTPVTHDMAMRFAVETISGVGERVTFGGGADAEGLSCVESTLDTADGSDHPNFDGLVVHHYGYPSSFDGSTVAGGYADPENLPAGDCATCDDSTSDTAGCGDGVCGSDEDCSNCSTDCGTCTTEPWCVVYQEDTVMVVGGLDSDVGCVHDIPDYAVAAAVDSDGTARLEGIEPDPAEDHSADLYGSYVSSSSCDPDTWKNETIDCTYDSGSSP